MYLARGLLGLLFTLSAVAKIMSGREASARAIRGYRLVPEPLVGVLVHALPTAELIIGSCLLAGVATRAAALGAAVVLASITVAAAIVLTRGERTGCGCFGRYFEQLITPRIILRNLALMGLALLVAITTT